MLLTLGTTGAATLLAFLINFLVTPFVTGRLGVEAYGFIALANTFVSYAMIAMTAISSFSTRYIALEYHRGDIQKASVYASSVFFANAALSVLIFVLMVPVIVLMDSLLDVPSGMLGDIQVLFVLVFVNFILANGASVFSCSVYIRNRLDLYGVFQVLSYVVEAIVLVSLYSVLEARAFYYGGGLLAAGAVLLLGNGILFKRLTPDLSIKCSLFSFSAVKTLVAKGVWRSVNSLGNVLISGVGLLVSNVLLSALAMGQLSISRTFSSVFSRLYQLVAQAFQPLFLESYSNGDSSELLFRLKLSSKMSGYVASLIVAGFIAFSLAFYDLWIPGQDTETIYRLTVIAVVGSFFEGLVNPLYYINTLTLKVALPTIVTIVGGAVSVVGTIALLCCTDVGVFGCAIMTSAVTVFIAMVTNPLYLAYSLHEPLWAFYPSFLRSTSACALLTVVFSLINWVVAADDWVSFVSSVVFCCILSLPIYVFVALNGKEREFFFTKFSKRSGRGR